MKIKVILLKSEQNKCFAVDAGRKIKAMLSKKNICLPILWLSFQYTSQKKRNWLGAIQGPFTRFLILRNCISGAQKICLLAKIPFIIFGKGQWKLVFRHWRWRPGAGEAWCWIGRKRNNTSPTVSLCPLSQHLQLFQKSLIKWWMWKHNFIQRKWQPLIFCRKGPGLAFQYWGSTERSRSESGLTKTKTVFSVTDWAWIIKLEYLFSVKT